MKLKLFVTKTQSSGESQRTLFEMEGTACFIGRTKGSLRISDSECSGLHAKIYLSDDGTLRIQDLESTNGTFIRSQKVRHSPLRVGDEIRIGSTVIFLMDFRHEGQTGSYQIGEKAGGEGEEDTLEKTLISLGTESGPVS